MFAIPMRYFQVRLRLVARARSTSPWVNTLRDAPPPPPPLPPPSLPTAPLCYPSPLQVQHRCTYNQRPSPPSTLPTKGENVSPVFPARRQEYRSTPRCFTWSLSL
ncbi:hypothetical protein PUN28_005215 [Cardiocondyla obscurior]|uniref:Uncharacterized protein n=1 Tax=Cardiocondyla obscurior TaxID=286306 RepID=A0AAW2GGL2_9HYME